MSYYPEDVIILKKVTNTIKAIYIFYISNSILNFVTLLYVVEITGKGEILLLLTRSQSTITNIFFPCTLENYFFFERDALLCGGGGGSLHTYVLIVTILKNCCTISNLLERFPI